MTNKKNKIVKNPYVEFYGEHKISPVNQDISNFGLHLKKREKLYRLLGLPPIFFTNRTVMEIGPGGGYNSLALFVWGANIDFVEPNPTAREQIVELLSSFGIGKDRWKIFSNKIEELTIDRKYDIVIAEGFIPGLYERESIIKSLSDLVVRGGVVVVTCVDDLSYFIELIKRIIAHRLLFALSIIHFTDKVRILSQAFHSHLSSLQNASRPIEDWVTDMFLNPAAYGRFFSIENCIEEFGDQFKLLGCSPSMFTNYSWYKDIHYDENRSYLKQFHEKHHLLLFTDMSENKRLVKENKYLEKQAFNLRKTAEKYEKHNHEQDLEEIISILNTIRNKVNEIDDRVAKAVQEGIMLIADRNITINKVAKAKKIAAAFGRGQQYVSMVKKFID